MYSPYKYFPSVKESKKIFTICKTLNEFLKYISPDKRFMVFDPKS